MLSNLESYVQYTLAGKLIFQNREKWSKLLLHLAKRLKPAFASILPLQCTSQSQFETPMSGSWYSNLRELKSWSLVELVNLSSHTRFVPILATTMHMLQMHHQHKWSWRHRWRKPLVFLGGCKALNPLNIFGVFSKRNLMSSVYGRYTRRFMSVRINMEFMCACTAWCIHRMVQCDSIQNLIYMTKHTYSNFE